MANSSSDVPGVIQTNDVSSEPNITAKKSLAAKPPLGWNSYDSYRNAIDEEETLENLEIFAQKLAPHGYEYFVLDYGWYSENVSIPGTRRYLPPVIDYSINRYGYPISSPTFFPSGIERIASRAHELGVKFGLHLFRGVIRKAYEFNLPVQAADVRFQDIGDTKKYTAWNDVTFGVDMSKQGSEAYYIGLIQHMCDLGVDFLKIDDLVPYPDEVEAIGRAIASSSRDIVFSLSPGDEATPSNNDAYEWGHLLRITADVWDDQSSLDDTFERWKVWQGTGKPGFWPDMDMLCLGILTGMIDKSTGDANSKLTPAQYAQSDVEQLFFRPCHFSEAQERTFMTVRALAASPLFMGGCLIRSEQRVFDLITNRDMLECNQNGVTGSLQSEAAGLQVWRTPSKDTPGKGWLGIFNRKQLAVAGAALELSDLGLPAGNYQFRSIWSGDRFETGRPIRLEANDVLFLAYQRSA